MKTVPLHGKKAAGRVALVDDADYDLVMQYRWRVWEGQQRPGRRPEGPYAVTVAVVNGKQTPIRMHNLIMGARGLDHRDHDGLNNQRSNLRLATPSQNGGNTRSRLGSSSQYKGVTWIARHRKWRAFITVDGEGRYLGRFASEEDAAIAYNIAALETFGEFACLNAVPFPGEAA